MIEEIKTKNGTSYRAILYGADGKRIGKTFRTKTLAKDWERRKISERNQQEATGVIVKEYVDFAEFASRWMENKVKVRNASATQVNYERVIRLHLMPIFGNLYLKQIRIEHANQLVSKLTKNGHSPKGINVIVGVLLTMLNDAAEWGDVIKNPLFRFQPVKEPDSHNRFWSREEIKHFLKKSVSDPLHDVYLVALNTGMRRGELCGLKWDRVDFVIGHLVVSRTLGRYGLSETTKTGMNRVIPFNPEVRAVIEKRYKARKGDFVFAEDNGDALDAHHLYREFYRSQKKVGFKEFIRFHDLRHTFASHFMMNGGSIYDLQQILGHTTNEMTQRYAHFSPGYLAKAMTIVSFSADDEENVASLEEARRNRIGAGGK